MPKGRGTGRFIFRPWITIRGVRLYARNYGRRAWKIWIDGDK